MAKTLDDAIKTLAERLVHVALFGTPHHMIVTAKNLLDNGRTRAKIWKELRKGDYITADLPDKPGEATMTLKAFDDYLARSVEVDLTPMYTFDQWRDHRANGNAFVVWDKLNLSQQVAIIGSLRNDPARYTLLVYNRYKDGAEVCTATLGRVGEACKAVGGWSHAVLAVTDASVKAKRDSAVEAYYKTECLAEGLNWFLHETGAFEKGEELPITERQPMLGDGFSVSRKPEEWPAGVSAAIQNVKDKITSLQQQLALLEKLEAYVRRIGGWPVFLADYESSIARYVRAEAATGKLAKGVR